MTERKRPVLISATNSIEFPNDAELSTLSLAASIDLVILINLLQTNGSMNFPNERLEWKNL